MSSALLGPTLVAATVTGGLTAGFLAAFSHTVMPALGGRDDTGFVEGFQALDRAVHNPWFLVPFTLTPVLAGVALVLALRDDQRSVAVLLVVATALAVATVAITAAVHLPLNRGLGDVPSVASALELADARARFERRWVLWNAVRAMTTTVSSGFLALTLLRLP